MGPQPTRTLHCTAPSRLSGMRSHVTWGRLLPTDATDTKFQTVKESIPAGRTCGESVLLFTTTKAMAAPPSVDIMSMSRSRSRSSSPDPLTTSPPLHSFQLSSQRATRSQRTSRFLSVDDNSPRKQTFELEVGDGNSPQKLLVTVETEGSSTAKPAARRRLFTSQSPMSVLKPRAARAVTTTVPLRDTIEEGPGDATITATTPRRRGRPPKTNGTPMPSAGTKRRAGTPGKRTPRRPRISKGAELQDAPSEASTRQTPKSARGRGRPRKNPPVEPSSELGYGTVTKSGRRRRQALIPDEVLEIADQAADVSSSENEFPVLGNHIPDYTSSIGGPLPSENDMDLIRRPEDVIESESRLRSTPPQDSFANTRDDLDAPAIADADADDDAESDIWMATLSDQATPRPARRARTASSAPPTQPQSEVGRQEEGEQQQDNGAGDYGYLAPAASDFSSDDDPMPRNNDTIAQGEDFSMIFMESIRSFHQDSRPVAEHEDFGDETNLIINNTLESLRQSVMQEEEAEVTEVLSPVPTAAEMSYQESSFAGREATPARRDTNMPPEHVLSPRLARSPRKMNSSPLRHRVLMNSARAVGDSPRLPAEAREQERQQTPPSRRESGRYNKEATDLYDDSFSEIPQTYLEAATPGKPTRNVPDDLDEDMGEQDEEMEEEEEEVEVPQTAAAAAAVNEHDYSRSTNEAAGRAQEEAYDLMDESREVESNHDIAEDADDMIAEINEHEEEEEEEAYSSENGLAIQQETINDASRDQHTEEEAEAEAGEDLIQLSEPPAPSNASMVSRSDHTRLPTPDDTPPYVETEPSEETEKDLDVAEAAPQAELQAASETGFDATREPADGSVDGPTGEPAHESPVIVISAQSEDGVDEEAALAAQIIEQQERERLSAERSAAVDITPVNQMSSPAQHSTSPEAQQEKTLRPALSPIMRAGRALQSVTSDPPSPEAVEKQLGSPFRRSASKESWSGSREGPNIRQHTANSPRQMPMPQTQPTPTGRHPEDPFGASRSSGQVGFLQALSRSLRSSVGPPRTASRASPSSVRLTHPDDEMSWIATEGPISPNLRGDNTLEEAARFSTTAASRPTLLPTQTDGAADMPDEEPEEEQQDEDEDEGDETDIWEFEARRDMPKSTRQQPFGTRVATNNRRSALPSPWTKRATQTSSLNKPSAPQPAPAPAPVRHAPKEIAPDAVPDESHVEEFSMLSQTQRNKGPEAPREPEAQREPGIGSAKPKRFDLSAFFSSPATLPGLLAQKLLPGKSPAAAGPRAAQAEPVQGEPTDAAPILPTSSMFPTVAPQKDLRPRSRSRVDLFSPVRPQSSQRGQMDEDDQSVGDETLATETRDVPKQQPQSRPAQQPQFRPSSRSRMDMLSPIRPQSLQQDTEEEEEPAHDEASTVEDDTNGGTEEQQPSSPPATAAPVQLPSISQKRNFTPNPRRTNTSFFQPSSAAPSSHAAPTPAPAVVPPSTPTRMQLTHADIERWQQETSQASEDSLHLRPLLRPLPPKNASPTKSSLRSPLKPHTPGRIVEFTSSVLSPVEQARARQERRLSQSSNISYNAPVSAPAPAPAPIRVPSLPPPRQHMDKENQRHHQHEPSDVSMTDASPLDKSNQLPPPLSQTTWTRQHWLFLDALLQLRRRRPFDEAYPRRADAYLGRTVKSHGEAMRLERWHLDCVDAFKAEIGGWDEAILVRRLFALILGEEKRTRRVPRRPTRVMFH
ncbi:hypothetical protein B0I35DRAFT_408107 [Stachybotrys elegans]|uniref:Uncharacterized protein n=1 Tax=Stachybotrys elegans TaxID=80388 RepID=A0A8K0WTZ9_9HYPO|nr:hypothetical protein B0I35DRAFT_408107 [Stachybotrys elegans]